MPQSRCGAGLGVLGFWGVLLGSLRTPRVMKESSAKRTPPEICMQIFFFYSRATDAVVLVLWMQQAFFVRAFYNHEQRPITGCSRAGDGLCPLNDFLASQKISFSLNRRMHYVCGAHTHTHTNTPANTDCSPCAHTPTHTRDVNSTSIDRSLDG